MSDQTMNTSPVKPEKFVYFFAAGDTEAGQRVRPAVDVGVELPPVETHLVVGRGGGRDDDRRVPGPVARVARGQCAKAKTVVGDGGVQGGLARRRTRPSAACSARLFPHGSTSVKRRCAAPAPAARRTGGRAARTPRARGLRRRSPRAPGTRAPPAGRPGAPARGSSPSATP